MKSLPLGSSTLSSSVIGFGAWAIGGGAVWGTAHDDAEAIRTIQAALDAGITLLDTAPAYGWGHSERLIAKAVAGRRDSEKEVLPLCHGRGVATLTYMSLEQGLLTGKIGMDHVFKEGEFRCNAGWFPWLLPQNRARVLGLLAAWQPLCETYRCTLAQLVLAWTLAQPGVTHVLAGARKASHIRETAAAADLAIRPEDLATITADLDGLGEPVR